MHILYPRTDACTYIETQSELTYYINDHRSGSTTGVRVDDGDTYIYTYWLLISVSNGRRIVLMS